MCARRGTASPGGTGASTARSPIAWKRGRAAALVVSQFTLLAEIRTGRRPAFTQAAAPERAEPLLEAVASELRSRGVEVATGRFGAQMLVASENDGPVTLWLDSTIAVRRPLLGGDEAPGDEEAPAR